MSDQPFGFPPVPLMTPEKAGDVGRSWKALADHLASLGVPGDAGRAERQSQWWLAYAVTLAQTPPAPDKQ